MQELEKLRKLPDLIRGYVYNIDIDSRLLREAMLDVATAVEKECNKLESVLNGKEMEIDQLSGETTCPWK